MGLILTTEMRFILTTVMGLILNNDAGFDTDYKNWGFILTIGMED